MRSGSGYLMRETHRLKRGDSHNPSAGSRLDQGEGVPAVHASRVSVVALRRFPARARRPIALLAVALVACSLSEREDAVNSGVESIFVRTRTATVTRVIDGDTIEVVWRGEMIDVRLIGIDTPETVDPSEPVGCYGHAASRFTTSMLDGQEVGLEFDVERTDRYDRTLAYVWLDGGLFNEVLVLRGLATVTTYPPNVKYVERFVAAQDAAQQREIGLWGRCQTEPKVNGGDGGSGDCDPSYPDVCIPPYPPDLDCGDVEDTNFVVKEPDPHGFDGNDDGSGCESG